MVAIATAEGPEVSSSLEPAVRSAREAPPVMDQDKVRTVTTTAVKEKKRLSSIM